MYPAHPALVALQVRCRNLGSYKKDMIADEQSESGGEAQAKEKTDTVPGSSRL